MKKEIINVNKGLIAKTKNQGSRKISLFKQAKAEVEKHTPVSDLQAFSEGFRDYLYNGLKKQSKGSLNNVGYTSLITLYDINDERLRTLEIEFKKLAHIKLNEDFTELAPFDANCYAETEEEIKRLNQFKAVKKFVEGLEKEGVTINYAHLSRAFYPLTQINVSEIVPNPIYIKGQRY